MSELCWNNKWTSYWSYPRNFTAISCTLPHFWRGWRGQKRVFRIFSWKRILEENFSYKVVLYVILHVKATLRIVRRGDQKAASEQRRFGMGTRDECDDNHDSARRGILHWRARLSIISRQDVILPKIFSDKDTIYLRKWSLYFLHQSHFTDWVRDVYVGDFCRGV